MDKQIRDIDIVKMFSNEMYENYMTALDFQNHNPDYSLSKFRIILEMFIRIKAQDANLEQSYNLHDDIKLLTKKKILTEHESSLCHSIRMSCNAALHQLKNNEDIQNFDGKLEGLGVVDHKEDALNVRKQIIKLLCIHQKIDETSIISVDIIDNSIKNILYDALTDYSYRSKLKAGIICEESLRDPEMKFIASEEEVATEKCQSHIALQFYEAACYISAPIKEKTFSIALNNKKIPSTEEIICKFGDLECLFRYGYLACENKLFSEEIQNIGMNRLKAAANKQYAPAETFLADILIHKEQYEKAYPYLLSAIKQDYPKAHLSLYYFYKDYKKDQDLALYHLDIAIRENIADAFAAKGILYHKGEFVEKNDREAEELLKISINKGSHFGFRYYRVEFEDLVGQMQQKSLELAKYMENFLKDQKNKPFKYDGKKLKPNDPCSCGSGKKYKKCCKYRKEIKTLQLI